VSVSCAGEEIESIAEEGLTIAQSGAYGSVYEVFMHRQLFDPLRFLEQQLLLSVVHGRDDRIYLQGISKLPPQKKKQAKWVLDTYEGLLRLQLDAPKKELRLSVQKLIAQGKLRIVNGRYVSRR
jgi:hypothetical protein